MNQSFWLNKKVLCFPICLVTWIISQETDKNRLNLLIQIFFNFSCHSGSLLLYKLLMKKKMNGNKTRKKTFNGKKWDKWGERQLIRDF